MRFSAQPTRRARPTVESHPVPNHSFAHVARLPPPSTSQARSHQNAQALYQTTAGPTRPAYSSIQRLSSPARQARVHPRAAVQSWLSLAFTIAFVLLRMHNFRVASRLVEHQMIIPSVSEQSYSHSLPVHNSPIVPLHLFAVPKPFHGVDSVNQLRALESWLALTPTPEVTLLGTAPGVRAVARRYGVHHRSHLDASFLGLPLLPSLLATVNSSVYSAAAERIVVLINADIVLFDDVVQTLTKLAIENRPYQQEALHEENDFRHPKTKFERKPWLAIAARWDVPSLPSLPIHGPRTQLQDRDRRQAVAHVRTHGTLHTFGGIDLWAWPYIPPSRTFVYPPLPFPFPPDDIPPFVFGRGRYDNWLTDFAISHATHDVVDVSEAITATHVSHDHHLVSGSVDTLMFKDRQFWSTAARTKFELVVNAHLAESSGTYSPQSGTVLHAPFKLSSCYETQALCKFRRSRPHACRCEYSPFVLKAQNDPYVVSGSNVVFCGMLSETAGRERKRETLGSVDKWLLTGRNLGNDDDGNSESRHPFGLPLTQTDVLATVANQSSSEAVIAIAADYSERGLLMETVCTIRMAGLFKWLVVIALDDDVYRFSAERGMAVYLAEYDDSSFAEQSNFRDAARLQTVIELLALGKYVFMIEPGVILSSSPWQYVSDEMIHTDVAFLQPMSVVNAGNDVNTHGAGVNANPAAGRVHSAAILAARPGEEALTFVKAVVGELEHGTRRGGDALWKIGCGPLTTHGNQLLLDDCHPIVNTSVHLLDINRFRPVEPGACITCDSRVTPLAWIPASRDFGRYSSEDVRRIIASAGLSKVANGMSRCMWT